ncbi:hypothetical protein XENORESO_001313 [Xenotaenia resolanae]|uniref:Uncharacterized protein n=1 Tax=Xenotaenia resolanae TaxID=208358 RepID=A0ABV0VNJ9_9TELE
MKAVTNDSDWCSRMSLIRRNPLPHVLSASSQLHFITAERHFNPVSAVLRLPSVTRECQLNSFDVPLKPAAQAVMGAHRQIHIESLCCSVPAGHKHFTFYHLSRKLQETSFTEKK